MLGWVAITIAHFEWFTYYEPIQNEAPFVQSIAPTAAKRHVVIKFFTSISLHRNSFEMWVGGESQ